MSHAEGLHEDQRALRLGKKMSTCANLGNATRERKAGVELM